MRLTLSTEVCKLINVYKELSYTCAKDTVNVNVFKGSWLCKITLGTGQSLVCREARKDFKESPDADIL